ncbi:MAG TPA: hypothetical protein VJ761_05005 [Ktedonobacteraceae bacterium]|nr:hypothetical protein [Ktedonobacteraceae bacterium]
MSHLILPAPLPKPWALYDGELASNSNVVVTANQVLFVGVVLNAYVTLTGVRVDWSVSGNGHYDVGIYDATGTNPWAGAPGNLLAHAASSGTALATAGGAQTPALIGGNLPLTPGRYWLALWADNASDKYIRQVGTNQSDIVMGSSNTGGPLPATGAGGTGGAPSNSGTSKPILIGILQGGWS